MNTEPVFTLAIGGETLDLKGDQAIAGLDHGGRMTVTGVVVTFRGVSAVGGPLEASVGLDVATVEGWLKAMRPKP